MGYFKILPQYLCEGSEINHDVMDTWSLVRDLKPEPFEAVMLTSARNSAQHFPNIYILDQRARSFLPQVNSLTKWL
jgi:hypothetical protein